MQTYHHKLTIQNPIKINPINGMYILRNITYSGDSEIVVFVTVLDKKPVRLCRMNGAGMTPYYLPIKQQCTFTMKGKGSITLSFTHHEYDLDEAPVSYQCEIITEEQRKLKL